MRLSEANDVLSDGGSWPLMLTVSRGLGLGSFSIRGFGWAGHLYAFGIVVVYYAAFFAVRKPMFEYYENFEDAIPFLEGQRFTAYANLIYLPLIVAASLRDERKREHFRGKVTDVDRILTYLDASPNREVQLRREAIHLGGIVIFTILTNLTSYFALITADCGSIYDLAWIFDHVPIFFEMVVLCDFVTAVRRIHSRLDELNHVIPELMKPWKITLVLCAPHVDNASRLKLVRRAHLLLHEASDLLNEVFGPRLLFIFALTFVRVIAHSYAAYKLVGSDYGVLDFGLHLIWATFHFSKYIYLAETCHATAVQARVAAGIFFETSVGPSHGGFNEEVVAFARQLGNKTLRFTVCNFLAIDYPTVLTIFLAASACLLVMVRTTARG